MRNTVIKRYLKTFLTIIWVLIIKLPLLILWRLFCAPGTIFISMNYFFPKEWGKDRNVAKSSRDYRNVGVMAPVYSFIFYFGLIVWISGS
tara:strand:+ start:444 stop:713 length:270 start_codon:yes stop_codon:yes gene_type:complete